MRQSSLDRINNDNTRNNLRVLILMRWIAIAGQLLAIQVTYYGLGVPLPRLEMTAVILFLLGLNVFSLWLLRRALPVRAEMLLAGIFLDVVALTIQLFLSGGATNPFTTLFMLQVLAAVSLLKPSHAFVIFLTTVLAQFWLLNNGLPLYLPMDHSGKPDMLNLHLQGMFLSFVLAAALAFWFIFKFRQHLIERETQLSALQRRLDEEDYLFRLGMQASDAAHRLGTPLATLAVTLGDWAELGTPQGDEAQRQSRRLLEELTKSRTILSHMLMTSGRMRLESARCIDIGAFLTRLAGKWGDDHGPERPRIVILGPQVEIVTQPDLLETAVTNLLDNAAQAGAGEVRCTVRPDRDELALEITDDGPGFPGELVARTAGLESVREVAQGSGLGLLLARNAMRRLGGRMSLANAQDGGGAQVTLTLPTKGTSDG